MFRRADFTFNKIFNAWKYLETHYKSEIERELRRFVEDCRASIKMAIAMPETYSFMYNRNADGGEWDYPIITAFLMEVEKYSKEAYDFLAEGHDMINFKEYIKLKGKSAEEIMKTVFSLSGYSEYLKHAFCKILNETDEKKKRIMLRGMLGI